MELCVSFFMLGKIGKIVGLENSGVEAAENRRKEPSPVFAKRTDLPFLSLTSRTISKLPLPSPSLSETLGPGSDKLLCRPLGLWMISRRNGGESKTTRRD